MTMTGVPTKKELKDRLKAKLEAIQETRKKGRVPIDLVDWMRLFMIMSMIMDIVTGVPPPSVDGVVELMVELVEDVPQLTPVINKMKEMMLMLMWFRTRSITGYKFIDDSLRFHFAKRDVIQLHKEWQKVVLNQPHYLNGLFNKHCMVIAGLTTRVGTPVLNVSVTPEFRKWSLLIGEMIEELEKLKELKKL